MTLPQIDTLNVLSLFSGIGGLELGLERAGMRTVGQVEIDPWCRSILARHWPDVPRHDDVRTARAWWLSEARPGVDIVAGGYPCQPESTAGKGLSTADERWLWPAMARVIYTLRPRWVIGENVGGHRTRGLRFVLRDLERLGYTATAGTIRACDLGAPHERKRIVTIAYLACSGTPLGGKESGPGDASDYAGQWPEPRTGTDRRGAAVADVKSVGCGQGRSGGPGEHWAGQSPEELANLDSSRCGPGRRLGPTGQAAERAVKVGR